VGVTAEISYKSVVCYGTRGTQVRSCFFTYLCISFEIWDSGRFFVYLYQESEYEAFKVLAYIS
jgi:hypothetical protein